MSDRREFGGKQGDFYISIPSHSLSKIQTAVLASNISGWQAMDQYKLSCQQEGTDGQKALYARQPETLQGFSLQVLLQMCRRLLQNWPQVNKLQSLECSRVGILVS